MSASLDIDIMASEISVKDYYRFLKTLWLLLFGSYCFGNEGPAEGLSKALILPLTKVAHCKRRFI
jgi:hypothetical protein